MALVKSRRNVGCKKNGLPGDSEQPYTLAGIAESFGGKQPLHRLFLVVIALHRHCASRCHALDPRCVHPSTRFVLVDNTRLPGPPDMFAAAVRATGLCHSLGKDLEGCLLDHNTRRKLSPAG